MSKDDHDGLRRAAEARIAAKPAAAPAAVDAADMPRLLHELQVHQIELQMQNEELRAARAEAEAALLRYVVLYDFAPVSYFGFDA
ncbi:MAG: Crp/Fnr family transcriptional regulator, partial [Rhodocyclaceae bacterium]|nr:Crp/Fnr family transcriptional regulator [Rhodocyclaceae bacterium]